MASDSFATRHFLLATDGSDLFLFTGHYKFSATVLFM
jgi:hypothetical protein